MTQPVRSESDLRKDAELIVDTCFTVQEDDVVTIITDNRRSAEAEAIATVASERGAWPIVMNNDTQVRQCLQDTHFPMAPPRHLHTAMVQSNEIVIVTNLEWANRFAHVPAVKESCANGVKIASVEEGFGGFGLSIDDIKATIANTQKAIGVINGRRRVRVTSPQGTDVTVSIDGRPALEIVPIKQPGIMMGPLPLWGEVAFAAVEDQTSGTVVVDGSMLGIGIPGHVSSPITWHVEDGHYRAIEGRDDATRLRETIKDVEGTDVVAEFAFGTSDFAPLGTPTEKGRKGTVHFALGDNQNAYPGGQNKSRLHLDGVVLNATMQILDTGDYILRDGEWQL